MAQYMGLRGTRLAQLRIVLVVLPAFLLYGYNQSVIGGVLSFPAFVRTFPTLNTSTTTGKQKTHNALIQGRSRAFYVQTTG